MPKMSKYDKVMPNYATYIFRINEKKGFFAPGPGTYSFNQIKWDKNNNQKNSLL